MPAYQLPCPECSKPQTVAIAQAGDTITCRNCHASIDVPTMRELKTLPVAGPTHEGSRSGWNVFRGSLFVAGTLIAGLAILAHFQIQPQRAALNTAQPKFEEIKFSLEDLTLESAWKAWNHFRAQDLDYRDTPEFLKNREKYAELSYLLYAAWTAAAVGLGLVLAALLWPSPRRLR